MTADPEQRQTEIRSEVGKLITEWATLAEEQDVYVLGWVIGYEGTSLQLESEAMALRGIINPTSQMVSASAGLGMFVQHSFEPRDWVEGE